MATSSNRLWVGPIPLTTGWKDLTNLFKQAGAVKFVEVPWPNGKPRGFAFVTMENEADNDKAIRMFNGYLLGDRPITVKLDSSPQQDEMISEATPSQPWNEFVQCARKYLDSGLLEKEEIEYKLRIGADLKAVREAVLNNTDGWGGQLKKALATPGFNLIHNIPLSKFRHWIDDSPQDALQSCKHYGWRVIRPMPTALATFAMGCLQ